MPTDCLASTVEPIAPRLLVWARCHGRHDLPWQKCVHRSRPDAYRIWVSEIMLQQTQVCTVIPYFERFITRFPDVFTLARASQDEVLAHWSGLGYYARGRNLHHAAQKVCAEHGGLLPTTLDALQALPGIGRSTAGAILALAYGQPVPILDGNVKRVLTRYHALPGWPGSVAVEQELWRLAALHTPARQVAAYTQAIMDLGATVCRRARPTCGACPLAAQCRACVTGRQADFPAPKPRRTLPVRARVFALIENKQQHILLVRRPPAGIWGGLWCLPDWPDAHSCRAAIRQQHADRLPRAAALPVLAHSFSHYHLQLQPLRFRLDRPALQVAETGEQQWLTPAAALKLGLPAPIRTILTSTYQTDE